MQLKIYNEIIVCLETIVYNIVLNVLNVRRSSQSITPTNEEDLREATLCLSESLPSNNVYGKLPGSHRVSLISGLECEMEWWNGIWKGIMSTQSYS